MSGRYAGSLARVILLLIIIVMILMLVPVLLPLSPSLLPLVLSVLIYCHRYLLSSFATALLVISRTHHLPASISLHKDGYRAHPLWNPYSSPSERSLSALSCYFRLALMRLRSNSIEWPSRRSTITSAGYCVEGPFAAHFDVSVHGHAENLP